MCRYRCHDRPKTQATGDFVAMMQGGLVDHQRALDAVAQVMAALRIVQFVLRCETENRTRSAVRAHRQHPGDQAWCPCSVSRGLQSAVVLEIVNHGRFSLHLTRVSSASAAIAMHMLCPSFKLCTRYVPRNRHNMTHAPLNRRPCKFKFAYVTFCRNASTSMTSVRTRRYRETLSLESANVIFIPLSDCCLHIKIQLLACPVTRCYLSVFWSIRQ